MNLDKNIETFDFLKNRWPLADVLKALIALNRINVTRFATEQNINAVNMRCTVNRFRNHSHSMAAISRKLGIPSRELFDGKR